MIILFGCDFDSTYFMRITPKLFDLETIKMTILFERDFNNKYDENCTKKAYSSDLVARDGNICYRLSLSLNLECDYGY